MVVKKKETVKGKVSAAKGKDIVFATGKRKRAIARASFKEGKGRVLINNKPLELIKNEIIRLKVNEPLLLAGGAYRKYNIEVNIKGGGIVGQAEAARQAIARGLSRLLGDNIKKIFIEYDKNLLAYDPRRTEPHKPPRSSQGPRRYKQRSKR